MQGYIRAWQLPLFLLYLCLWLIGGTYVVRWALQRFAELPRSKATMARSFRVNFLSGSAAHLAAAALMAFFLALGFTRGPKHWAFVGIALAPVAMFAMAWLVQWNVLSVSSKVLLRIVCATTLPLVAALAVLGVGTGVVARQQHMHSLGMIRCELNLKTLNASLDQYAIRRPGSVAPRLETLVDGTTIKDAHLRCPGRKSDQPGYLYAPTPDDPEDTKKIRLCDRRGNHGDTRLLIFADDRFARVKEEEFLRLLALPENAEMRKLAEAD
ncbi:MAG: hypothetical protein ACYS5V_01105 [Planctomycetota bacterium]|jgi:hypothetical protein